LFGPQDGRPTISSASRFRQRLLVERVKAVLRRAAPRGSDGGAEGNRRQGAGPRACCAWIRSVTPAPGRNEPVTLTVTEFLILQALATRPGVVEEPQRPDGRSL